jgi:hypothetical protein
MTTYNLSTIRAATYSTVSTTQRKTNMTIKSYEARFELFAGEVEKGGVGAELGVCKGFNAMHLYHICKPKTLHLVDYWEEIEKAKFHQIPGLWYGDHEELNRKLFEDEIAEGTVEIHRSLTVPWLKSIEDRSLDWVYVDAGHHYHEVRPEVELLLTKLKVGGLMMGDDYFCIPQAWGTSVIRAVNESMNSGHLEMLALSSETQPTWCCKLLK